MSSKFLVIRDRSYASPYRKLAKETDCEIVYDPGHFLRHPEEYALVVFTGGHDVSPVLYGRSEHRSCGTSFGRDSEEVIIAQVAIRHGIPLAGICRGSQFLCVMAGGRLVQDMTNHAGPNHNIIVDMPDGSERTIEVTSSHHQMQYPFDLEEDQYEVIGASEYQRSSYYQMDATTKISADAADDDLASEPDIVYYPKIKALAAQYHPEWMREDSDGFRTYEELADYYLKPLIEDVQTHATQALS